MPANPDGWYMTFEKFTNKYIATDKLFLPLQTSAPVYRYEVATNELIQASRIARGSQDQAHFLEAITRDIPSNFVGGGTSFKGGATQFVNESGFLITRIVDMNTGQQVWP